MSLLLSFMNIGAHFYLSPIPDILKDMSVPQKLSGDIFSSLVLSSFFIERKSPFGIVF